jgi:hypothetical protein
MPEPLLRLLYAVGLVDPGPERVPEAVHGEVLLYPFCLATQVHRMLFSDEGDIGEPSRLGSRALPGACIAEQFFLTVQQRGEKGLHRIVGRAYRLGSDGIEDML